jgi:hypothetical protein
MITIIVNLAMAMMLYSLVAHYCGYCTDYWIPVLESGPKKESATFRRNQASCHLTKIFPVVTALVFSVPEPST